MRSLAQERRLSPRTRLRIPLRLDWGEDACAAETLVTSESGALGLCPEPLLPGLILELENRATGETARARVVSCGRDTDGFGYWPLGLALLSPHAGFFRLPESDATPPGSERRRSPRVALVHPVELVRERHAVAGRTRSVSRHGALVLAQRGCSEGEPLWLRSLVSGRAGHARVVRSSSAPEVPRPGFDVALEFDQPPRDFWGPDYDL